METIPEAKVESQTPPIFDDNARANERPNHGVAYELVKQIPGNGQPYSCLAIFPWTMRSLEILWGGTLQQESTKEKWRTMLNEWTGAIALGGTGEVIVRFMAAGPNGTPRQSIRVTVPKLKTKRAEEEHFPVSAMTWALSHDNALSPLLVFSCRRLLFIVDLNAGTGHGVQNHSRPVVSKLQGHGGTITSITTHPRNASWICTTSQDFTARIYDVSLPPSKNADDNPCWMPGYGPSKGGVPHGLRSSEEEGTGLGRCVVVLVGNKAGGHQAAVLGAAFHPTLPAIATCGVDRAVKVWRTHPRRESLVREDKCLFSTDRIHRAMIQSVTWLDDTTLITASRPVVIHKNDTSDNDAGTLSVWSVHGLQRFFPTGQSHEQNWLRGSVLDSQDSASFHIQRILKLPHPHASLRIKVSPFTYNEGPLLALSLSKVVRLIRVKDLPFVTPPAFPVDKPTASEESNTSREDLTSVREISAGYEDEEDEDEDEGVGQIPGVRNQKTQVVPWKWDRGLGWDAERVSRYAKGNDMTDAVPEYHELVDMAMDGELLVTGDSRGRICIWLAARPQAR